MQTHFPVCGFKQFCKTTIRKAFLLQAEQNILVQLFQRLGFQPQFNINDILDLCQEPWIDVRQVMHFFQRKTLGKSIADIPDAIRARFAQFFLDHFAVTGFFVQAVNADFQSAQRLLKGFLEGAAYRHDFTDRFHLRSQVVIRLREFFKCKTWNLGDNVIDGRLKRSRSRSASNVIAQFIKGITNRQFRRNFGNRETGGF